MPPGVRPTEMSPLASRFLRLREILRWFSSQSALTRLRFLGETVPLVRTRLLLAKLVCASEGVRDVVVP